MKRRLVRVLIVEDDRALCSAIGRAAESWGEEIAQAHSVAEAIEQLRRPPDLVITDVRLPDGSGLDVARRASRLRPAPFIVAISGEATPEEAFQLAQAGTFAYLSKPISLDELTSRVEAAIEKAPDFEPVIAANVGHTPMRDLQDTVRRIMVDQALALSDGSRRGAARLLNVSRQAIQQAIREHPAEPAETPETLSPPVPVPPRDFVESSDSRGKTARK